MRRAELRGERRDNQGDSGEYEPGKYIRAKREAREAQKQNAGFGISRKSDEAENDDGEA